MEWFPESRGNNSGIEWVILYNPTCVKFLKILQMYINLDSAHSHVHRSWRILETFLKGRRNRHDYFSGKTLGLRIRRDITLILCILFFCSVWLFLCPWITFIYIFYIYEKVVLVRMCDVDTDCMREKEKFWLILKFLNVTNRLSRGLSNQGSKIQERNKKIMSSVLRLF